MITAPKCSPRHVFPNRYSWKIADEFSVSSYISFILSIIPLLTLILSIVLHSIVLATLSNAASRYTKNINTLPCGFAVSLSIMCCNMYMLSMVPVVGSRCQFRIPCRVLSEKSTVFHVAFLIFIELVTTLMWGLHLVFDLLLAILQTLGLYFLSHP